MTGVVNDNEAISLAGYRLSLLVQKALQIREAVETFDRDWQPLLTRSPMPMFAWGELERQLVDLAPNDLETVVKDLVSAVRKESAPKPPEMVLREILIIAATVLDEGFHEKWLEGSIMT